jgi:predicted hydrolase (HD superfamily)
MVRLARNTHLSALEKTLYNIDELTGLVAAAALVTAAPPHAFADVESILQSQCAS